MISRLLRNITFFVALFTCFSQVALADLPQIGLVVDCPATAGRGKVFVCNVTLTAPAQPFHNDDDDDDDDGGGNSGYWEVHLTTPHPANVTFLREALAPECARSTTTPNCFFSPLPFGTSRTFQFRYRVNTNAPCNYSTKIQFDVKAVNTPTNWVKDHVTLLCAECTPGQQQHLNCTTGLSGICSSGRKTRVCDNSGWWGTYGSCVADIQPGDQGEQCSDGKDNDCDGRTDGQDSDCFECWPGEKQHQNCGTGLNGVCAAGKRTRTCNNSGWFGPYGSCVANINPGQQTEQCSDGLDNDCDGRTDSQDSNCFQCTPGERQGKGCTTGLFGICSTGTTERTCLNNGTWTAFGACRASVTPGAVTEICNDNLDNDCDGLTDGIDPQCAPTDQCQAGTNESRDCSTGLKGVCAFGKQYRFCQYNKEWSAYGSCFATVQPGQQQEICGDSQDNDCDGLTDEQCGPTPTPVPDPVHDPAPPKVCSLSVNVALTKSSLAPDKLRDIANKAASHVMRRLGRSVKTRAVTNVISYAEGAGKLCDDLYSRSMRAVNDMPDQFQNCAAGSCGNVNYSAQHESYAADITQMTKVTRKLSRGYNKSAGLKSRRMLRLRRNANKIKKALLQALSRVPSVTYHCN